MQLLKHLHASNNAFTKERKHITCQNFHIYFYFERFTLHKKQTYILSIKREEF